MAIDINHLRNVYFTFDTPVPYHLRCGIDISIAPVKLIDSICFTTSYGILDIDKNSTNNVDIIQMSYLKFLDKYVLHTKATIQQFVNICLLCLGFTQPYIRYDDKDKAILSNADADGRELFYITAKEFDDIKRIILYQNLPNYDDEYIDPELKANMQEMDELKSKGLEIPSLERRIAIISSHTGIPKAAQRDMTFREHTVLFNEVVGEVEYSAIKGMACYCGQSSDIQWVYKKAKSKYEEYITTKEKFNKSMGGDGKIATTTQSSDNLISQYDNFIGG